ncbi:MAG: hypothetical protein AUK44_01680 [Porphyromonadaceae bacterium CG2_30_38_12]|nr:MAG: hypothetical protein AUK44_01680 [Porphyromonadaceae bacterium CG2_30_38_12]
MVNWRNIIGIIGLISSLIGCDDNYVSSIPSYPVSLKLNLSGNYSTFKNNPNQFRRIEKPEYEADRIGFGGILVYCGMNPDEYYAFDMACPYEAKKDVKIYPLTDALGRVKCEGCGSVYDVSFGFGNPLSGPSKEILKKYKTTLTQDYLYIYP